MGIVPIWGFQMITAIALSFVFRLNKALVLLASNISIPPIFSVVLFLSHWAGGFWMGNKATTLSFDKELTFDTLQEHLVQYALGAVTLASVSGLFFGLLTYILLITFSKPAFPEEVE